MLAGETLNSMSGELHNTEINLWRLDNFFVNVLSERSTLKPMDTVLYFAAEALILSKGKQKCLRWWFLKHNDRYKLMKLHSLSGLKEYFKDSCVSKFKL